MVLNCVGTKCYDMDTIFDIKQHDRCVDFDYNPIIIGHRKRVIAVGDIHGDMNLAINFLKAANVIKEHIININNENMTEVIYKFKILLIVLQWLRSDKGQVLHMLPSHGLDRQAVSLGRLFKRAGE